MLRSRQGREENASMSPNVEIVELKSRIQLSEEQARMFKAGKLKLKVKTTAVDKTPQRPIKKQT